MLIVKVADGPVSSLMEATSAAMLEADRLSISVMVTLSEAVPSVAEPSVTVGPLSVATMVSPLRARCRRPRQP